MRMRPAKSGKRRMRNTRRRDESMIGFERPAFVSPTPMPSRTAAYEKLNLARHVGDEIAWKAIALRPNASDLIRLLRCSQAVSASSCAVADTKK